jgi:single-stranded-DNA-specific exonuclease
MDAAVRTLREAVHRGDRITVYGDYDVDGLTASAIVLECLSLMGADVHHYIPHRIDEGYGLSEDAVRTLAAEGTKLIVTVDCGVSAIGPARLAKELGMRMVVTDHHEVGDALPEAEAVVNVHRRDSAYPFTGLAGVGVAFKLCWALADSLSPGAKVQPKFRQFLLDALALVALGTIADIVPLVDENRVLVKSGLTYLAQSRRPGLQALRSVARLADAVPSPWDVAFKLAPRLNAAGRMEHGEKALELLMTRDRHRAATIAAELNRANTDRQELQKTMVDSALERIAADPSLSERIALVLADPEWHLGVVGIVAGKLCRELNRPVIVCNRQEGYCKGSARSIETINIYEALHECAEHLDSFGGHARAAGIGLSSERFEAFCEALEDTLRRRVDDEALAPRLTLDASVDLKDLDGRFLQELEMLEPFGESNPAPLLSVTGARLAGSPRLMGKDGRHMSFHVNDGTACLRAVGFGMGDRYDEIREIGEAMDLAFTPRINDYRGSRSIELHVEDVREAGVDV